MSKRSFGKITFIYFSLVVILCLFSAFGVEFRGSPLVTLNPILDIELLSPIRSTIIELFGSNSITDCIWCIMTYGILWFVFICIPMYMWYFIKGVFRI